MQTVEEERGVAMNSIIKRCGAALAAMALLLSFRAPMAFAEPRKGHTIRVAYPIQPGLTEIDENGQYAGYTYEYLREIAQYTGWEYEFVQLPGGINESLLLMMDMLEAGDIDLMGGMLYSKELAALYNFSSYSYGTVDTVLQTLYDDPNDIVINSMHQQTLRVAVLEQSQVRKQELLEFCAANLITPEFVNCQNGEEQMAALEENRADVLLNTSLNHIDNVRTVAKFASRPFYFAMSKQCGQDLLQELNAAIRDIERVDPYFSITLEEKYFSPPNDKLILSERETAFVQSSPPLRVGVLTNEPPFQQFTAGGYQGVFIDILKDIAAETGLRFSFVPLDSREKLSEALENGEIELTAGMTCDYDRAQALGLAMSRPFLSVSDILLLHDDVSESGITDLRQARVSGGSYQASGVEDILYFDTILECIRAVNSGKAEYTYVDAYTGQYYLNHPEYNALKAITQVQEQRQFCFGVVKGDDNRLLTILNKAILLLSSEQIQAHIYANTLVNKGFTLSGFIRQYPVQTGLTAALVLCLVFGAVLLAMWQRIKASRRAALELKKHLLIYQLADDFFFEYDYRAGSLLLSRPSRDKADGAAPRSDEPGGLHRDLLEQSPDFQRILASHEDRVEDILLPGQDGARRWYRVAVKTVQGDTDGADAPAYAVGKITDIDEERREQDKLREQANLDSLTRLLNAGACREAAERGLESLASGYAALLLVDVDHFKSINDTYGHMRGDQILRRIAALLREAFREEDVIGRPGGDEFVVFIAPVRDAEDLRDKCAALLRKTGQVVLEEGRWLSISVGAALASPGQRYDALYEAADKALYAAKAEGRSRFVVASAPDEKASEQ